MPVRVEGILERGGRRWAGKKKRDGEGRRGEGERKRIMIMTELNMFKWRPIDYILLQTDRWSSS